MIARPGVVAVRPVHADAHNPVAWSARSLKFPRELPRELLDRQRNSSYGLARYTLRNRSGKTLLQRRFGVLPKEFSLSLFLGLGQQSARLLPKGAQLLDLQVVSKSLAVEQSEHALHLRHHEENPPTTFILEAGHLPMVDRPSVFAFHLSSFLNDLAPESLPSRRLVDEAA